MKDAPSRRRGKVLTFKKPEGSGPMTAEVKLDMRPVRVMLAEMGVDWDAIPESEYQFVVNSWRRDRIARGTWMVEWQADGENYVASWAKNHRWADDEVVNRMITEKSQRKPGDITEAQRDAMGHTAWMEWSGKNID